MIKLYGMVSGIPVFFAIADHVRLRAALLVVVQRQYAAVVLVRQPQQRRQRKAGFAD